MIYVITHSMAVGKEKINCLFHNAFSDRMNAQKEFESLQLSEQYPRKSIWAIYADGRRSLILEEDYA